MLKNGLEYIKYNLFKNNIQKKLDEIKSFKRKIKVLFYVFENQKWGYQSLYEAFELNEKFEPMVVVSFPSSQKHKLDVLEENYLFFKSRGINVEYGFLNGKHINLRTFNPDIVFYEQPWGIPKINMPYRVSNYALTCHCSYSISANSSVINAHKKFYEYIWKYFISSELLKEEYSFVYKRNLNSLVVSGHPKLDYYNERRNENKKHYVIYAPHHAIKGSLLNYGTFDWSGQFMLEYAKAHPEFNWVFKPHPNIKYYFNHIGYMTEEEIDNYYNEWAKFALVCDKGDYFNIFDNSDVMITDCGSFLVEYLFTGKPLIHLVSETSTKHTSLNRICSENYYKVFNIDSLNAHLDEILVRKNDFLRDVRNSSLKKLFNTGLNSSKIIFDFLFNELELK